ncbi:MAG: hypothetical protein D4R38_00100 [Dehalococcoidia bacterium]|nr:MAG: hypothetical protein D4R38_00100 [Dehalococcoidia bacterium]
METVNILGFAGSLRAVSKPEVFVTFAGQKFDDKGKLTDEATRGVVADLLKALVNLASVPAH